MTAPVDRQYYEVATPGSLAEKMVALARDRIYDDFLRMTAPSATSTILDIGASDVVAGAANVLERKYPYPRSITAAGLGDGSEFKAKFPEITYKKIDAEADLPFPDEAFDIATCNAVLEHVGSHERQVRFVNDLLRVARHVYITVPHRFFPVEHHTGIPFGHWNDVTFRAVCKALGKMAWTEQENLILMTRARLRRIVGGKNAAIGYTGIVLGPFSSNIYLSMKR